MMKLMFARKNFSKMNKSSFGKNLRERIFYSLISYNFDIINNDWQFEPIILSRNFDNKNTVTDFVAKIKYLKNNWISIAYGSDETSSFGFGFKANKGISLHMEY